MTPPPPAKPSPELWQFEAEGTESDIFAAAEALGFLDAMEALSLSVFETAPGQARLEAGYRSEADARAAGDVAGLPGRVRALPPTDWVAKAQSGLAPVRAGRFRLHGSHDRDRAARFDGIGIEVEAGAAFGSGHHPTTRGCLEVFSSLLEAGVAPARVLDLGCGTGVLAIAAALSTRARVVASDIDPDAVEVARRTAALNAAEVEVHLADGLADPRLAGPFDLVFANILAGPLKALAPDVAASLGPGARLILSGLLDAQADAVARAYGAQGLADVRRHPVEGWTTLLMRRPTCPG